MRDRAITVYLKGKKNTVSQLSTYKQIICVQHNSLLHLKRTEYVQRKDPCTFRIRYDELIGDISIQKCN